VRVRLAALSGGRIVAAPEPTHLEVAPLLVLPERQELVDETTSTDDTPPLVVARSSLRPVVVAVAATALVAWVVVRVTVGGSPSTVEVVPGTPIPMASEVIAAPASPQVSPSASLGAPPSEGVVVQVVGQVRRPGLVRLTHGARVADAVAAAGGLVRGGSSGGLNLARQVVDGEQIVVSPDAVAAPSGATGGPDAVVVDLNSATLSDLDALPGVGPVMAGRILDWRMAHGRFTTVDQLREVSGIGARTFERLKPHVRV
jgi:competence protein ComEA